MSVTPTSIKPVRSGALTAASNAMTAPKKGTPSTEPRLDADGNPIKEDGTSSKLGREETEDPKKTTKYTQSESAKRAAEAKAVEIETAATTVPGVQQPIKFNDVITAQQNEQAAADRAATQKQPTTPSWQGAGADLTSPAFNSSNPSVLEMGGKTLQEKLATDDPSKLLGGFTSPETPSPSQNSGAAQGAQGNDLGGGLGGANAGPGGININSGNVNINSGNVIDSFNGGGNVDFNNNGFTPVTPNQPEVVQQRQSTVSDAENKSGFGTK